MLRGISGVLMVVLLGCDGLDGGPCPADIPASPFDQEGGLNVIVADFQDMPGHAGDDIADALARAIEVVGDGGTNRSWFRVTVRRMACRPADHADAHRLADRWNARLVIWGGPCVANAVGSVCPRATVRRHEKSSGGAPRADLDLPAFAPDALVGAPPGDPIPFVAFVKGFWFYELRSVKRALGHWLPIAPLDGPRRHGSWTVHRYLCQALHELPDREVEAARHCRAALDHMPDPDKEPAGYVLNLLGLAPRAQVPVEQAVEYLQRAVAIARAVPGDQTLSARLRNLSRALYDAGRAADAVDAMAAAMTAALERPVVDRREITSLHEEAGVQLWRADLPAEALEHFQAAMAAPAWDSSLASTATIMWAMALAHRDLGEYAESADVLRKAIALKKRHARPGERERGPSLIELLEALGKTLGQDEEHVEAEAAYREALALREAADPPTPLELAALLETIGSVLLKQGRPEDAQEPILRARTIRVAQQGAEHADVAGNSSMLGWIRYKQARFADAVQHFESARARYAELGGPTSAEARAAAGGSVMASCGISRARCAEAVPIGEQALAQTAEGEPGDLSVLRFAYALSLVAARRYAEAAAVLQRVATGSGKMTELLPSVGVARLRGMALAESNRAAAGSAGVIVIGLTHFGAAPVDLQPGDVIVRYAGRPVATVEALVELIGSTPRPTQVVRVRAGQRRAVTVQGPAPVGLFQGMSPEPFWFQPGAMALD